jgi:hypothetical protein
MFMSAMVRIFSFGERWNVPFNSAVASLNGTFHISPHENILTIALINIHYLYIIYTRVMLFQPGSPGEHAHKSIWSRFSEVNDSKAALRLSARHWCPMFKLVPKTFEHSVVVEHYLSTSRSSALSWALCQFHLEASCSN